MTKAQRNILMTLNTLPAHYRIHNMPGGAIKMSVLECYDGRTLNSLVHRGWLGFTEYGAFVTEAGKTAIQE